MGEPFVQGANAKGRPGTGLGLYVVRMLSELQGGRFELQSHPSRGTRASMHLPLADDTAPVQSKLDL